MDLTTQYLGMELQSPMVMSSSPLTMDLDNFKKLEDEKIGAIVMHSIYEEQVKLDEEAEDFYFRLGAESFQEAITYVPKPHEGTNTLDHYTNLISKAKQSIKTPIIASINAFSMEGWAHYAKQCEEAGASALELNIYFFSRNVDISAERIEDEYVNILSQVKSVVDIPVSIKVSPFFTNFGNLAKKLSDHDVDGLVLFNRFYQPNLQIKSLKISRRLAESVPHQIHQQTLWIGLLYGNLDVDFAATGGIHSAPDVIRVLMAGADTAMVCSAILNHGIGHFKTLHKDMISWMELNGYPSASSLQGILSSKNVKKENQFLEAHYIPLNKDISFYRGSIFPRPEMFQ